MAIFLKVLSGPDAGKRIEMQEGVTLGRSPSANFTFSDPRMSGRHVQVVRADEGLILVDLGSKNGFRVDGMRSTKTAFISGSSLKIGNTEFEVISDVEDAMALDEAPPEPPPKTTVRTRIAAPLLPPITRAAPPPQKTTGFPQQSIIVPTQNKTVVSPKPAEIDLVTAVAEPVKPKPARLKWPEYFVQFIKASIDKVKSKPRQLRPFRRLVKLSVINGIQTESVWTIGYGPRHVGPQSCDLIIEDPGAPAICFSLTPDSEQVIFSTDHPDIVKVNEHAIRSGTLNEGDVISFASTSIQFGFEHE